MDLVRRVVEQMTSLNLRGRAGIALAAAAIALLGLTAFLSRGTDMAPLYTDLSEADAGRVVEKLRAAQVQYKLSADGRSVSVPWDRVADLRLELAADGIVRGSGTGLELFERGPFGQSELAEEVTYTRALQGELARTIAALEPVEHAMVHVSRPRQSVFLQEDRPAGASVVVRLRPGRRLSARQLAGIRSLVAASVQGLDAERVSVLDESGTALAGPGAESPESQPGGLERERSVEEHLTRKAQSLLDAAFGPNRAIVRIGVRLTREKFEERREKLDPGVAKSESTSSKTSRQKGGEQGGGAGTASNVPGAVPARVAALDRDETEETVRTEYELGRSTSVTVREAGGVERLTVGLLLDAALDEKAQKIESIVKEAVGFDPKRGDTFQAQSIPIQGGKLLEGAEASAAAPQGGQLARHLDQGIAGLAAVVAGILGVLALKKGGRGAPLPDLGPTAPMTQGVQAAAGPPLPPPLSEEERRKLLSSEAAKEIEASPDLAGQLLEQWLREERGGNA